MWERSDLGHILNVLPPSLLEGSLQQIAGFTPRMAESGSLGGAGGLEFLSTFQGGRGPQAETHCHNSRRSSIKSSPGS